MPREFTRADRIADQIQRELAQLIQREVKDPRLGMVNISEVRVTRDFGYADIYITLLSAEELTEESPRSSRALRFCGAHPDSCVVIWGVPCACAWFRNCGSGSTNLPARAVTWNP